MLDDVVNSFLGRTKQEWLRKEIKPKTREDKIKKLKQQADLLFTKNWLNEIVINLSQSKDIDRLKYTSHSPKFSHPDVKLDAINFKPKRRENGYLATGNNDTVNLDMYSNSGAAYLKKDYIYVYEFLVSKLPDGLMIIEHLQRSTQDVRILFTEINIDKSYAEVKENLLKLISDSQPPATSEKVKQVYFPVNDDYHNLSLLLPSPLMTELKLRVNNLNYSQKNKQIRRAIKDKIPLKSEISELFNLTKIGFGGANKQNISVLNNKHGGYFYLMSSLPPRLEKRQTQPPKNNFFDNCLWAGLFKMDFKQFHEVLSWRKNNIEIRDMRDDIVLNSIIKVQRLVENIRSIRAGWSDSEIYNSLPKWQKIWLDNAYAGIRNDDKQNQDYITNAQSYFANWFIGNYKLSTKDNKLLGDDDIEQIKKILKDEQELLQ